ncbi:hypothetical protein DFQ27_000146, partial [Actinomortierella ambigua]
VSALIASTTNAATIKSSQNKRCFCLPGQPCWPAPSDWSALNDAVGGRLIVTTPVARECHDPNYDKARCDDIQAGYFNATWRQNQPGAVVHTNWETFKGQGCLGFDRSLPCLQGAVSLYTVEALSAADVQATVRFAAKHKIRLVVKNTGHCYLGRSSAANSINLWVHHMNKIDVVDSYIAEGAPAGTAGIPAVIMEGGVLLGDMYKAVHDHGRVAVGGAYRSVSAVGGYCQGGGHSPISRYFGLCVDNVLQYKVVTADGELRVANAYQNQDLFWALRGGGGGTFGVVVEGVVRTHPEFQSIQRVLVIITATDEAVMQQVVSSFYAENGRLANDGWSGYTFVERHTLSINYFVPNATVEQAKDSLRPFLDHVLSLQGIAIVTEKYESFSSFYEFQPRCEELLTVGGTTGYIGGRLIPQEFFQTPAEAGRLATTMRDLQLDIESFNPNGTYVAMLVGGGEVAKAKAEETSVTPAWRKALMLLVPFVSWTDNTPYKAQLQAQGMMTKANGRLIKLIPDGGAYINEADPNEPNWGQSFFGDNYARLRSIKQQYDPTGVFVCRRCVGSEDWDSDLMCHSPPSTKRQRHIVL